MKVIILIGPPGSGKGTQAILLSQATGWSVVSSTAIIKEKLSANDDPSLDEARAQYNRGDLVDFALVGKWTVEHISHMLAAAHDRDIDIIMDGTTRSMTEVKIVAPFLIQEFGLKNVRAIFINVSTEEALRRNRQRRICDRCQRPVLPATPDTVTTCVFTGCKGNIIRRDLDRPEVLVKRQQVYQRDTAPVLNYLRDLGVLIEVNGEQPVARVHREIMTKLDLAKD